MTATYMNGNVRATCPDCAAITTFEFRIGGSEFGTVSRGATLLGAAGADYGRALYVLMRCASCGRGGLATVYDNGAVLDGELMDFYPLSREQAALPPSAPEPVVAEFREAELCAAAGSWRGGSALLRSALEKTLAENGYATGSLYERIDAAAADGVITAARQRRAHDEVRSLGNDVLHEEWRPVTEVEYEQAHHYVQRIIEDFYDHRAEVEATLVAAGRIQP